MTAVSLQIADHYTNRGSPRGRGRRTQVPNTLGGRLSPAYAIYDAGQLIGTIVGPVQKPTFGAAAPTVLLVRSET